VATLIDIAIAIINSDISQRKILSSIDTENLDRRVDNLDVTDGGRKHLMGIEELGLRLAAVRPFSVPPTASVSIQG
jgi:hypothetical protein